MPQETKNASKPAVKGSPPPSPPPPPPSPTSPPPPTPPLSPPPLFAVDTSPVSSLYFDIRKFPDDPKIISIRGGDIYDPRRKFVSYDLLLDLIRKDWPVDTEKQQLLMNWTFRILDSNALNHCVVQLCKYGRQMHEIVLCDLVDGRLPEAALKIQAGLKNADKFFWQGKLGAAPLKWSPGKVLKGKVHDVRRDVAGEATGENLYPRLGKRRNTAGAHRHIGSDSLRGQPAPPESEHAAKRRDHGRVPITGLSGGQMPVSEGTDRVARWLNVQTLSHGQGPGLRRGGEGIASGAIGVGPPKRTPEEAPLPVVAETLQSGVPADAPVVSKPVAADASAQELESRVAQRVKGAKEIPTEQIRVLGSGRSSPPKAVQVADCSSLYGPLVLSPSPSMQPENTACMIGQAPPRVVGTPSWSGGNFPTSHLNPIGMVRPEVQLSRPPKFSPPRPQAFFPVEMEVSPPTGHGSTAVPSASLGIKPSDGFHELLSVRGMSAVPAMEIQSVHGEFFAPERLPALDRPVASQARLVGGFQSVSMHPSFSEVTAAAEMERGAAYMTLRTPKVEGVELHSQLPPAAAVESEIDMFAGPRVPTASDAEVAELAAAEISELQYAVEGFDAAHTL